MRLARGRLQVRAELGVEAPAAHLLAQREHLGRAPRIGAVRHHAVEARERLRERGPFALSGAAARERAAPLDEQRRRAQDLARPDAFALDFGVLAEGRARRRRQAEVHGVAELVAGESQPQAHRLAAQRSLYWVLAALHRAREALGAGPQRGLQ